MYRTSRLPRLMASLTVTAALFALGACGGGSKGDAGASVTPGPRFGPTTDTGGNDVSIISESPEPQHPVLGDPHYLATDIGSVAPTGTLLTPADGGEIKLPGGSLTVHGITTVASIPDPETGEERSPDPGEHFKYVSLSWTDDDTFEYDAPEVTYFLSDEQQTQLPFEDGPAPFLASVSDEAELVLKVAGRDVRVQLTTGLQVPDAVLDVLDRPVLRQDMGEQLLYPEATVATFDGHSGTVSFKQNLDHATLMPMLPGEVTGSNPQWAKEGYTWLLVSVDGMDASYSGSGFHPNPGEVSQAVSAAVEDQQYRPTNAMVTGDYYYGGVTAIEVPVTITEAVIALNPTVQVKNLTVNSLTFGSKKVTVTFPHDTAATPSSDTSATPLATPQN